MYAVSQSGARRDDRFTLHPSCRPSLPEQNTIGIPDDEFSYLFGKLSRAAKAIG
jgi:hypothetical protein